MDIKPLFQWINERHAIYHRKRWLEENIALPSGLTSVIGMGHPNRLTVDPILSQYRFCNVFRELDRVTVWIDENIRKPYHNNPNLWLMLAIARTINWPPTLAWLIEKNQSPLFAGCWPDEDFNPAQLFAALEAWKLLGNKLYTGAYTIRAESNKAASWYSWSKQRYVAEIVIGRLWQDRAEWTDLLENGLRGFDRELHAPTLQMIWQRFQSPRYIGWGPFMGYQVVVDLRWTRYLQNADDIQTWAALGPGSRRGLNRLAGREVAYALPQAEGLAEMRVIHAQQDQYRASWVPPIDLSDIQNCLCETDKYLRVKLGEGRPRAQYIRGRGY